MCAMELWEPHAAGCFCVLRRERGAVEASNDASMPRDRLPQNTDSISLTH